MTSFSGTYDEKSYSKSYNNNDGIISDSTEDENNNDHVSYTNQHEEHDLSYSDTHDHRQL